MTCLLEANPTPQIRWYRDTTEVGAGGRYTITLQRDGGGADLYTAVLQIKVGPLSQESSMGGWVGVGAWLTITYSYHSCVCVCVHVWNSGV